MAWGQGSGSWAAIWVSISRRGRYWEGTLLRYTHRGQRFLWASCHPFALCGSTFSFQSGRTSGLNVTSKHFHPKQELIATCGVDHTVNIWAVPPSPNGKAEARLVNDAWPMFNLQKLPYARLLCVYWYFLIFASLTVSLNDSRRLSDKIVLCQSTVSVEAKPGLVHAGELIVWEWLSYDGLYNDPNNPPPSWETGRALAVCPFPGYSDSGGSTYC